MLPRKSCIVLAAIVAAIVSVAAVRCLAQDDEQPLISNPVSKEQALLVLNGFEKAWRAGNAKDLASYLSDSRVLIEIRDMGKRGGYFSRAQALFIFRNLFTTTTHTRFKFLKYHHLDTDDRKVYGVAHRSYRGSRGGILNDRLIVTLSKEGGRWVVVEIKST